MPADRPEITEIATGLATYDATELSAALADPPPSFGGWAVTAGSSSCRPEAKVHLDIPRRLVAGYWPLG